VTADATIKSQGFVGGVMSDRPRLEPVEEALALTCSCGWTGVLRDITDYEVEPDRDRVLRCCPDCGTGVPEWGALASIDGVARVAKGPLLETLVAAGVTEG